jgi:hypothetical protein
MNINYSQFELLPNQTLIDIFDYFDVKDLFRAFYDLNTRFNTLLQSLNNLCLTCNSNDNYLLLPYISTLILDKNSDISLNSFPNLRHIKLLTPTYNQLNQLKFNALPYLEHLSIGYQNNHFSVHTSNLWEKIFTNGFPNLKSCKLFEPRIIKTILYSEQTPSLRYLSVDKLYISSYEVILSTCPNLYFLQFTAASSIVNKAHIKAHKNLKRMIIKYINVLDPLSDRDTNLYLSYVPNLEYLTIHQYNLDDNISKYLNYQWFALFIQDYLPFLQRFKCYFHVFRAEELIRNDEKNIVKRLETNFKQLHNNRYQSKFICNLSSLSFWEI